MSTYQRIQTGNKLNLYSEKWTSHGLNISREHMCAECKLIDKLLSGPHNTVCIKNFINLEYTKNNDDC